jgi:hypothetical protein
VIEVMAMRKSGRGIENQVARNLMVLTVRTSRDIITGVMEDITARINGAVMGTKIMDRMEGELYNLTKKFNFLIQSRKSWSRSVG